MKNARKMMDSKKEFRTEIEKWFPEEKAEKIWRRCRSRLAKIYRKYPDLPRGVRTHTDAFIFPVAAIYLTVKEYSKEIAFDIVKESMLAISTKRGEKLKKMMKIPGFRYFFLGMWEPVSRKKFGKEAGFENVFYPKVKGEFRMDITACPYHKYLTELGCPEINPLFCDNDVYTYGALPGLRFIRTKTIGSGGDLCDFKLMIDKK